MIIENVTKPTKKRLFGTTMFSSLTNTYIYIEFTTQHGMPIAFTPQLPLDNVLIMEVTEHLIFRPCLVPPRRPAEK